TLLANGKAYEIVRVVQKLESPPAEKVTITSKTSYVYGNGQLVAKLQEQPINSAPKIYYYHNDHLGSARVITDKDGKVVEQYFYYPFGGGGPVGGPTFTGKELDESGLFYFGARYYDPALGRFITPDPVDIVGSNPYVYCYNNPLVYVDPNGEFAWWAAFLIGGFVSAGITYFETGEFSLESFVIGGMMSLMTYGIAFSGAMDAGVGAGVAETLASNRVIASGITQVIMSTDFVRNELGIDNFWESVFASAFIQAGIETTMNWQPAVRGGLSKTDRDSLLSNQGLETSGRSVGKIFKDMGKVGKISIGGEEWYYGSDLVGRGEWPIPVPARHVAVRSVDPTKTPSGWKSYLQMKQYGISGVCYQDVGRLTGKIPTLFYPTFPEAWLTVGVYGGMGGPGALPAYLLMQYVNYRDLW
ncbi:MAG: RHS repeat-associated core domain-containing protein, partial [bacterium]